MKDKLIKSSSKSGSRSAQRNKKMPKSGLSPPKDKPAQANDEPNNNLDIDKTQWENTRFKDEARGLVTTDPDVVQKEKVGGEATPLLLESRQVLMVRGEHLLHKPLLTLILVFVEVVFSLIVMISWAYFLGQNEIIPIVICFANLIICLLSLVTIFSIEYARIQVQKEDIDEDYRYRIPYEWKYWLCMGHLLRFFLTCSNITIASLDDNFDGGCITIIAAQPIMLILVMAHVFFALRPQ